MLYMSYYFNVRMNVNEGSLLTVASDSIGGITSEVPLSPPVTAFSEKEKVYIYIYLYTLVPSISPH